MTPSSAAIPRKAPWLLLAAILLLVIPRAVAQGDSYTLFTNAPNAEEPRNYPMGPIGGQYRITDKAAFARVVSIEAGGPGAAAGLQPGDMILGVFGKDFPQAGQAPNGVMKGGHHGVSEELGFAVDRAEGADGRLPLHLIRPGVGRLQVTVQLDPIGAFGPTFPIASPKYDITYETAVAHLHNAVMGGNGDQGYFTGWVGLCLLGHPDWDKTTGTKAYRASINRIRDFVIGWMNGQNYSPNEDWLYDGTRNPNFKSGASNWQLGNRLMFLAEYYQRTKNTDDPAIVAEVRAAMQRGAELAANNIQWWKQPSLLGPGGYSPSGPAIAGMTSHGGVTGDYIHLGWGGGINICGGYGFMGMSFARRAGADMTVRPIDGHYFGYTKQEFQTMLQTPGSKFYGIEVVEPGKELYDHTVQEKFLMHWKLRGYRNAGYSTPGDLHDGHTCYQFEGWNPGEAVGKTAATIVGMMMYQEDGGQLTADDIDRLNRMKLFITRNYMNVQDSHAYCVGAQGMLTLAIPFLNDRQQRFALDNWRFFHALGRNKDQRFQYFRSRYVNDNYLGEDMPMAVNVALPGAVLNGRLSLLPGLNRNRILARFDNPNLRWPEYEARHLKSNSRTVPMPFTVFDGNGVQLNPSNYQVQWSKVSGLGNVTFADDQITFATDGSYRVTLTVTRGSYVLEEPIDVVIQTLPIPQGHVAGSANYDVYKDIPGSDVYSLVTHWKFPDFPDEHYTLKSSEGDWSGDRYGSRLSGVIVAPVTGTYRFYIDSADGSQLRINTNGLDGAKGPVVATFYSGSGDRRVFNVSPTQASGEYLLNEGQAIGFEALHKEDGWSDHLSVAWSINGSQPVVIPGDFLAHAVVAAAPMAFLVHPASVRTTLGSDVTLSVSASGPAPAVLQWRRNGQRIEGANSPTLVLNDIGAGADAEYDCTFTSLTGTITSKKARVSIVDVGLTVAGALWQEVYTGIGGTAVSDLTTHSKFPYQADQSGPLTSLSTGDLGDSYGQRWTGWITPPTSGNYRFYLVSDDSAELFLSTDATIGKAVSIVANPSWKNSKQWSANAPSAWKALVGGQKYYIEVRHKEGGGGDNCAVAWQREGDPAPVNGTGEIPGSVLSYRTGGIYPDTLLDNAAPWFDPATIEGSLGFSGRAYGGVSLATYVVDPNSMDLPALVFSKVSGPAWLQVAANGTLSGTPGAGHVGPNEFTVRVTDPGGLAATATLRIQVQTPNTTPTFVVNPAVKGGAVSYGRYEGQTLAGDVTDPDAWETLSFERISGPSWLEVSADGGLGGIPTFADAGTNAFVVRVTDKAGDSATATLNVVVDPVRAALTINGRTGSGATLTGFNKNDTLTVSTAVSRGFGVITGVDFYVGQTLLGSDSTDPYSVEWTAVPAGTHVVKAKVKTSTSYATFDLSSVTIHVEDPPVVPTRTHVATTAMPVGRRVGLAIATPGAGRTMAGWTLLNETNRFAINNQGEITLLQPANIGTGEAITLRVRAIDNLGTTGEGAVNILGNPPVTTTVNEQRWAGTTAYNNQDWSGTPSYTGTLTTFTTASNVGENYSRRITGFIQAPVTGDYRFWVASDDNSRVYLGSDETGSSKSLIITAPYAPYQNWDYKAEQKSGLQRLVGGKIYWLEVHHLEIGGGDYASVAWSGPGFARRALGGADVYPLQKVSDVAWVGLNAPVTGGELYKGQVLSLTTTVVEGTSAITRVEFRSGDTLLGSDTTAPYTLDWQNIPDGRHMLTATAVTADGSVTSEAVRIDVVFRPVVVPSVWVATRQMPVGATLGTLSADVAPGLAVAPAGWAVTSGNAAGIFALSPSGQLTLGKPALLTGMQPVTLQVSATDTAGRVGQGTITVLPNPPDQTGVYEERWADGSVYPNPIWTSAPEYVGSLATFEYQGSSPNRSRRLTGYIQPTASGTYYFHVASDDQSEVYLSTDENPANKSKLAYESGWRAFRSFPNSGVQKSGAITLQAGKVYYMEVRHWNGSGDDHVSVGWTKPGSSSIEVIPSSVIYPSQKVTSPAWVGLKTATGSTTLPSGVPFTLNATAIDGTETVASVEFYANGSKVATKTQKPFSYDVPATVAGTRTYTAKALKSGGGVVAESLPLMITFAVNPDPTADADGDGYSTGLEQLAGSNPQDASSVPGALYQDLVGWWRLDDGSGTALANVVSTGPSATLRGASAWADGFVQKGLALNGTDQSISFGSGAAMSGPANFSASAWVRIATGNPQGRLFQQRGTASIDGQYTVTVEANGTVSFFMYNGGSQFTTTSSRAINDNRWHLVTAVRDGPQNRLYIDDALAASATHSATLALTSLPFVLGRDERDSNRYLRGTVDEVRLYRRALTTEEVASLYREPGNMVQAPRFDGDTLAGNPAEAGMDYAFDLSTVANDPNTLGSDVLTFAKVSGPTWLSVAGNGALSGTPSASDQGANSWVVRVTDSNGTQDEATLTVQVSPQNYWTVAGGGSWGTSANWLTGVVPAGSGSVARFNRVNLTADAAITLDGSRTVGTLAFDDTTPSHGWKITSGTGGTLTLDGGSGMPTVDVGSGILEVNAVVAGGKGLTKTGAGTLLLTANNTYTGETLVEKGTLAANQSRSQFNNSSFNGKITIRSGATLAMTNNPMGWGGGLTNVHVDGGRIIGTGGLGAFGVAYDLTGGSIEGSARLDLGQYNSVSGALRSKASSTTSVVKNTGGIMLRVDSGQTSYVLGAESGTTPSGMDLRIESGIGQNGTASLRKEGDGTVALTGSSSYTGATTIAGGTLLVNGSLANTAVTVQSGGTLGGTGTVGGSVTVQGVLAPGSLGIGTLTINNSVTLSGSTRLQVQRSGSILSSDRIAGATSIVAGGTLEVEALGDALVAGDSFTLFNVQPTGSFASVKLPGLAAGLGWQATQNNRVITVAAIGAQAIAAFTPVADQVFAPGKTVSIGVPTASSGLPVVVSVKSGPATVSGGTVTLQGAGTVVLAANQSGNGTYGAAAEVTTSFVVAKGPQSITFAAIPSQPLTASPLALVASASSGLAVAFELVSGPALLSGSQLVLTNQGVVQVRASQVGGANFLAASPVTRSFTVTPGVATVTLGGLGAVYDGTAKSITATTVPPGLPVQILYGSTTNRPVNAGTYAVRATVLSTNYTGEATGSLVVARAPVTVRAESASRVYGAVNPMFRTIISGVPAGGASPVFTLECAAGTNAAVGAYPITVKPGTNPNYAVTGSAGVLTVTKAFVLVVATDKSKLQGQANPVFGGRFVGLMPWDSTNLLSGQVSFSCPATASSPVGLYSIGVTGPASLPNYTVYYQPGVLTVRSAVEVVGRWMFYNRSGWDGNDAAANASDDAAVAPDKSALLPGRRATFANYTSYASGLNGVMVDVFGLPAGNGLTSADFEFRAGNTQTPLGWPMAPAPNSIAVRRGAGAGGSDRVTLTWAPNNGDLVADANEAVAGGWLQVTVKANARTGLAAPDTFYLGNAPGETGNSPTDFWVTAEDANAASQSLTVPNGAGLSSRFDFNRNKSVDLADWALARARLTAASTALVVLDLGAQPGPGGERRPAGLMGEQMAAGAITVPTDQLPALETRLSADGREVMFRMRDDGLPWRLQQCAALGDGTWSDVARGVERDDNSLTWRIAVQGGGAGQWYRVVNP